MKKIFSIFILVATLLALLVGCAKTPLEEAQAKVVEIGEQYLNFEITGQEAIARLGAIRVPEAEKGDGKERLETSIELLIGYIQNPNCTYEDIRKQVNRIKSRDYTLVIG